MKLSLVEDGGQERNAVAPPVTRTRTASSARPVPPARFPSGPDRRASNTDRTTAVIKRSVDVIGSAAALVFFLPLMVVVSLLIWFGDPGPLLFGQERLGKDRRRFRCFKFRTMAMDADKMLAEVLATDPQALHEWRKLQKLKRDPRVTKLGRFLRASSIDELPQFWNVLKGEMSLVGPRPIVPGEDAKYGRYITEYYSVKPGLTGLWQISGRSNTTYRRRVALDVTYTRRTSTALDLWILAKSVPVLLGTEGSY